MTKTYNSFNIKTCNVLFKTQCSIAPPLTVASKDAKYNTTGNFECLYEGEIIKEDVNETTDTICTFNAVWKNKEGFSCLTG